MFRDRKLLWTSLALATGAGAVSIAGCLEPRELEPPRHQDNCTTCHGSPTRPGDALTRSAPPFDLSGNNDPASPGVGAHQIHLAASDIHAGIECAECHLVPTETSSPGHADTALPAEVIFGTLARSNERAPVYDPLLHACADTHCHLDRAPSWLPSSDPAPRCERCHGMPPADPMHPASDACHLCHDSIDAQGVLDAARHIDGVLDLAEACDTCHGSGELGAPPPDLSGQSDIARIGVGAHATHLEGGAFSRPLACSECHQVPETVAAAGHLDDSPRAEVMFSGVALANGHQPSWDFVTRGCSDSHCHGTSSPAWTSPEPLACDSCHGFPPAAPHPQMRDCSRCHGEVIDENDMIVDRQRHVDGVLDLVFPTACNACHGDADSAAPPADLANNVATTFAGVGAHRAHVEGSGFARPVPCGECHRVPAEVIALGHVDTFGPAEVLFSGVARAFGASPEYNGNTCTNSYCHGDSFVFGHESGGAITEPVWTLVDGSQKQCDSCHGLPPPPPHPPGPLFCNTCHPNAGALLDIVDPLRHVDGVVDL